MSVTKSVVGTLGAMLVAEGRIDANNRVADYVPELSASAFGDPVTLPAFESLAQYLSRSP